MQLLDRDDVLSTLVHVAEEDGARGVDHIGASQLEGVALLAHPGHLPEGPAEPPQHSEEALGDVLCLLPLALDVSESLGCLES